MSVFLEYIHGWVWVVVTVEDTFMGGCAFKITFMDEGGCL